MTRVRTAAGTSRVRPASRSRRTDRCNVPNDGNTTSDTASPGNVPRGAADCPAGCPADCVALARGSVERGDVPAVSAQLGPQLVRESERLFPVARFESAGARVTQPPPHRALRGPRRLGDDPHMRGGHPPDASRSTRRRTAHPRTARLLVPALPAPVCVPFPVSGMPPAHHPPHPRHTGTTNQLTQPRHRANQVNP